MTKEGIRQCRAEWANESFWSKPIARWRYGTDLIRPPEVWNHAGADPIKAAEVLIKLEAREARLLGLDMPTQVAVTDPDGGIPLETIRRVMERVDRQMVDVTPEPAPLPLDHKRQ